MSSQVKWIIHDFAPHWLLPVATQLGINLVFFCIYCASSIAFFGPLSEMLGRSRQSPEDFKLHEMVSHQECMDIVSDFERLGTLLLSCKIITIRSCFEVEPGALRLLSNIHQKLIVPLGLLPPSLLSNNDKGDEDWEALKNWLNTKQERSVFYVAIGSEVSLSEEFMHELAFGIEKSMLPFIWVVRKPPLVEGQSVHDINHPGFEERVLNRGLVFGAGHLNSWSWFTPQSVVS